MSDPVYAGLFVGSGTTTLDTVVFTNSNGIPINVRIDSTTIGSIPVKYNMYQTERNAFFISTEGYMKRGSTSTHNYVTKLLQNLSRERQGQWHSTVSDSAWIPVVLYDMRANTTNSNFQGHPGGLPVKTGMIQNYLDADRKPVLKANVYFNDQLNNWFRPSGADAAALFDPTAMRWSGLKNRPDAKGGSVPDEWVGNNYDSTNANADIVIFDSLKFLEKKTEAGVFTFGDSIMPHWLIETGWTSSDPAYFNYTRPPNVYNVFSPLRKWNYAANTIPASRPYARGFGFDLPSSIATRPNPLATHSDSVIWFSQNYAYTMEIHRLFTYKPGQKFIFMGNDDVWLFINNALVLDMGGVHGIAKDSVNLDALGLTSGNEYWFDFFYCERNGLGAEIFITTNMLIFLPPQPLKRSWKRDYGNLD
jgi:fibro-slime domain-containing protein